METAIKFTRYQHDVLLYAYFRNLLREKGGEATVQEITRATLFDNSKVLDALQELKRGGFLHMEDSGLYHITPRGIEAFGKEKNIGAQIDSYRSYIDLHEGDLGAEDMGELKGMLKRLEKELDEEAEVLKGKLKARTRK